MKTCKDCVHNHVCGITHSDFGEHGSAAELRRASEIQASDASRIKFWCRKIGFDPSANG